MLFNPLSLSFLLRLFEIALVVLTVLLIRGFIRQKWIRRLAQEMLAGKRPASEESLDRCIREIGGAPGYQRDEEMLRQLTALRDEIHRIEKRLQGN